MDRGQGSASGAADGQKGGSIQDPLPMLLDTEEKSPVPFQPCTALNATGRALLLSLPVYVWENK